MLYKVIQSVKEEINYTLENFDLNNFKELKKILINSKGNIYTLGVGKSKIISSSLNEFFILSF